MFAQRRLSSLLLCFQCFYLTASTPKSEGHAKPTKETCDSPKVTVKLGSADVGSELPQEPTPYLLPTKTSPRKNSKTTSLSSLSDRPAWNSSTKIDSGDFIPALSKSETTTVSSPLSVSRKTATKKNKQTASPLTGRPAWNSSAKIDSSGFAMMLSKSAKANKAETSPKKTIYITRQIETGRPVGGAGAPLSTLLGIVESRSVNGNLQIRSKTTSEISQAELHCKAARILMKVISEQVPFLDPIFNTYTKVEVYASDRGRVHSVSDSREFLEGICFQALDCILSDFKPKSAQDRDKTD